MILMLANTPENGLGSGCAAFAAEFSSKWKLRTAIDAKQFPIGLIDILSQFSLLTLFPAWSYRIESNSSADD